jgi:protein-tyrosine-phosphatase
MADGLLRKKVQQLNLNVEVDSAGTSSLHEGEAPDARMRETAREFNTPIDELRSRPFVVKDFDRFDLIFAMDKSNMRNIVSLARNEADKNKVLIVSSALSSLEFDGNQIKSKGFDMRDHKDMVELFGVDYENSPDVPDILGLENI